MIVYIKKDSSIGGNKKYYLYTNKYSISYSDPIYLINIKNVNLIGYIKISGIALISLDEIL